MAIRNLMRWQFDADGHALYHGRRTGSAGFEAAQPGKIRAGKLGPVHTGEDPPVKTDSDLFLSRSSHFNVPQKIFVKKFSRVPALF